MIDVDRFKGVNDAHGHEAGDRVLVELAQALRHAFRNDDLVCRLGGDEFLVVCPDTDLEGALRVAEKARLEIGRLQVETGGALWLGSIGVGVAARDPEMEGWADLIRHADEGVYLAKEHGKNCVRAA